MPKLISEYKGKARKDYNCDACMFLREFDQPESFSGPEQRAVARARENHYKIKKGDIYLHQTCKSGGVIYTFRAIPEIHNICLQHSIYPED